MTRLLSISLLALTTTQAYAAYDTSDFTAPAGVTMTGAESVLGREATAPHCRVTGRRNERNGINGLTYALDFELTLPDNWNGSFVHQFNGGNDGAVKPTVGPLISGDKSDKAIQDTGLVGCARLGFDPAVRATYGYTAVRDLNPVAEALAESFYGTPIDKTYGIGGSNGGRHAMVAAARMPAAIDGLLIGYPGFNLPRATLQHALDVQAFRSTGKSLAEAFSPSDMTLVAEKAAESRDALNGLEDGMIGDAIGCQATFNPATLTCCANQNSTCLSAEQVASLETIQAGSRDVIGAQLYAEWAWDTGMGSGNWRFWNLQSTVPLWNEKPIIAAMGADSLAQIFTTPPTKVGGALDALEDYLMGFDIPVEAGKIFATDATFTECAMGFLTPPGADNLELAAFRDAGGKTLIVHEIRDPVFSVLDTTAWYDRLDANNGGAAIAFARLYAVPGMPHGAGGPSTDVWDVTSLLETWVNDDTAPEAITASVSEGNAEGLAAPGNVTRKLCSYPSLARYTGGDAASADNFPCEAP